MSTSYMMNSKMSDSEDDDRYTLDFSYMDLEECGSIIQNAIAKRCNNYLNIRVLLINNNLLETLPFNVFQFDNLIKLDISNNCLNFIPDGLCKLRNLKIFIAKENSFEDTSIPKEFSNNLTQLQVVNLSGNRFKQFPYQLLEIETLKELYLGGNKIQVLPKDYENLSNLEVLYLGGNRIMQIPEELSQLHNLKSLNLSFNRINTLPVKLANLKNLKHLSLHNNNLTTLPIELVKLNLSELSLRNNPLVSRFVRDLNYRVPTLLELAGRVVKSKEIFYDKSYLPVHLVNYLNSAHHCLNPKCHGVYFTSKVEHVKFVDFCGKYRVPLMQYLCSPKCNKNGIDSSSDLSSDSECDDSVDKLKMKKILFG